MKKDRKNPGFGTGEEAFKCGSRLLAPTWANTPIPQGILFGCSDMVLAPSHGNVRPLYHVRELSSIEFMEFGINCSPAAHRKHVKAHCFSPGIRQKEEVPEISAPSLAEIS